MNLRLKMYQQKFKPNQSMASIHLRLVISTSLRKRSNVCKNSSKRQTKELKTTRRKFVACWMLTNSRTQRTSIQDAISACLELMIMKITTQNAQSAGLKFMKESAGKFMRKIARRPWRTTSQNQRSQNPSHQPFHKDLITFENDSKRAWIDKLLA